jgi:hypothetical protein
VALVAVPPGVVMTIFPVFAPVGTVAVTSVFETTVKLVAATPPKVTFVAPVRLMPVMVTFVPVGPMSGLKFVIWGITRKIVLLNSVPLGIVTLTFPVVAPAGTVVVISDAETTVKVAAAVLKMTELALVRFVPRMVTLAPALPDVASVSALLHISRCSKVCPNTAKMA